MEHDAQVLSNGFNLKWYLILEFSAIKLGNDILHHGFESLRGDNTAIDNGIRYKVARSKSEL